MFCKYLISRLFNIRVRYRHVIEKNYINSDSMFRNQDLPVYLHMPSIDVVDTEIAKKISTKTELWHWDITSYNHPLTAYTLRKKSSPKYLL